MDRSVNRWYVLVLLCFALFMLLLDGTIVNIAIPAIMEDLQTGFSEVEWVMNAYLLVFAVLLVTMGRLGDLYGRRRFFLAGVAVFTTASLLCGLSPRVEYLIGFRALQGLGGAMIMPATLSIITAVFPAEQRGMAMGIWGGVSGFSLSLGPSLGGFLVELAAWPYIFFINLPVGVAVMALGYRGIPESRDPTSVRQIDYPGVALLSAALFSLTFALVEGQGWGWTSPEILGLFGAAALGLVAFVLVERVQRQPLMDFSLFRNRTYTVANTAGLIVSFGMMGVFFLLPIFLQAVLGYDAITAGLVLTPLAAIVIVAAPTAGKLSDRVGSRGLVSGGILIAVLGFFLIRNAMAVDTEWPSLIVPFLVTGFGIGMVIPPMTAAVMGSAPVEKAGQASGVLSTLRQLGSVLGIAVMGAVLQNRVAAYLAEGAAERLSAVPGIPAEVQDRVVSGVGSMAGSLGEMSAAGGAAGPPAGVEGLLAGLPEQARAAVAELFGRGFMLESFVSAMQTTFLVAMAILSVGFVVALFIRSHVEAGSHIEATDVEAAAAGTAAAAAGVGVGPETGDGFGSAGGSAAERMVLEADVAGEPAGPRVDGV